MERFNSVKAVTTFSLAGLCAKFGWLEIQLIIFLASMSLDFVTGSCLSLKNGSWNSKKAKDGIFHKLAIVITFLAALLADWMIGNIMENIPGLVLPFTYTVMLSPLVMIWYTLAELGSIIENVGLMGAPVPVFIKKAFHVLKDVVEETGDKLTDIQRTDLAINDNDQVNGDLESGSQSTQKGKDKEDKNTPIKFNKGAD